jgi:general stress protein YciG
MEKQKKGFALLDKGTRAAISRLGGKAAQEAGTAHQFTVEEAREAGRKGGKAAQAARRESAADAAQKKAAKESA